MLCAQRRSAPERARSRGGGTERVFFSITLTKRITYTGPQRTGNEKRPGGTCRPTTDDKFYTWRAQPCDNHLKERFLSLLFLFVCLFLFAIRISRFFLLTYCFLAIRIFSFRFTDTPWLDGITLIGKTATTTTCTRLDKNKKEWNA